MADSAVRTVRKTKDTVQSQAGLQHLQQKERSRRNYGKQTCKQEQEKYRDEADYFGRFPELDAEFHKIMIDSVNRSAMMRMLDSLMLHLARWRNFDVAFDNRVPKLIEEHKKIFEAIEEGNIQKAQDRMGEHLETITAIADRAMAKYPTYFKNG